MHDKILPYNLDLERAVIGAMMIGNIDTIERIRAMLKADYFYASPHRRLFGAICYLVDHGTPVDQMTVYGLLQKHKIEQGLTPILSECINGVATDAHAETHADMIRKDYQRRTIILQSQQLSVKGYDKSIPLETLLSEAEKISASANVSNPNTTKHIGDAATAALDNLEKIWQNPRPLTGLTTGHEALNDLTDGYQFGDLVYLGARPSQGKTSFALFSALAMADQGEPVSFVSLETSASKLALRAIADLSRVSGFALRKALFTPEEYEQVKQAEILLKNLPIYIIDDVSHITDIVSQIRRMKREYRIRAAFIDYMQLVRGDKDRHSSREQEVAGISWTLKMLAKELGIPIIALSQLGRGLSTRGDKRPTLFDFRESGSLEQDADMVLFLHRPIMYGETTIKYKKGKYNAINYAEIIVAKNKEGPTGYVTAEVDMSKNQWKAWVWEDHFLSPDDEGER